MEQKGKCSLDFDFQTYKYKLRKHCLSIPSYLRVLSMQGVSEKLPQANAQSINAIQFMDNLNQDNML